MLGVGVAGEFERVACGEDGGCGRVEEEGAYAVVRGFWWGFGGFG